MGNLRQSIYRDAMKEGRLRPGLYDPIKGEMKKMSSSEPADKKENNNNSASSASGNREGAETRK